MNGHVWHGRAGSVALGPTQHRVARYLDELTRHGRIVVRTSDLAERLGLERSEAYRILARLRVLGLFGVSNDRGGHAGGRVVWRTATRHDGTQLDPVKHRLAFARVRGAAAAVKARVLNHTRRQSPAPADHPAPRPLSRAAAPGRSFADLVMPGLGAWFHESGRAT